MTLVVFAALDGVGWCTIRAPRRYGAACVLLLLSFFSSVLALGTTRTLSLPMIRCNRLINRSCSTLFMLELRPLLFSSALLAPGGEDELCGGGGDESVIVDDDDDDDDDSSQQVRGNPLGNC
jgi:hypothetical protein